ncbi:MAG: hypothetical protein AB8U25_03840 [Rickettsiales endosymbiont of Dermacentor nuttalli]
MLHTPNALSFNVPTGKTAVLSLNLLGQLTIIGSEPINLIPSSAISIQNTIDASGQ